MSKLTSKAGAIIFLDGRSAYYATVREFLWTHTCETVQDLEALLDVLLPDEDVRDEALAALLGPGLLEQADIPSGLQDYLRSHLRGTWFTLDLAGTAVQHTRSGTSPGSPLADLLYQFVQSRFMRNVVTELADLGLNIRVQLSPDPVCPQGWADDVAVLLPLCTADCLVARIQQCLPVLDRSSRAMGVALNYDSGKTEVLVCVRGKGSVSVRRQLLSPDEPVIPVSLSVERSIQLRVVERYLHLGNIVCTSATCLDDVKGKVQSADGVFRRLQSTLLQNPELRPQEKTLLVGSLVLAKVKYGAGLWVTRSAAEERSVHNALSKYWRMACRSITGHCTKFLDENEIASILGVLTATEALRVERCRQLCTACENGPGFLWHCLLTAKAWLQAALTDLCHVQESLSSARTGPYDVTLDTLQKLQSQHHTVRAQIKRYAAHCIAVRGQAKASAEAKATAIAAFEAKGGILLPAPVVTQGHLPCDFCSLRFSSRANLAAHLKSAVSVASGSACSVCQVEWWTTFRLREHLRRSPDCLRVYQSADLGNSSAFETTGSRQQKAWRPPAPCYGAQPWWATLDPPAEETAARLPAAARTDFDGLRTLADAFSAEGLSEWAPRALSWVRLFSWEPDWLEQEHPAHCVFGVLASIVEQAGETHEPLEVLHSHGVTAHREGNFWWLCLD